MCTTSLRVGTSFTVLAGIMACLLSLRQEALRAIVVRFAPQGAVPYPPVRPSLSRDMRGIGSASSALHRTPTRKVERIADIARNERLNACSALVARHCLLGGIGKTARRDDTQSPLNTAGWRTLRTRNNASDRLLSSHFLRLFLLKPSDLLFQPGGDDGLNFLRRSGAIQRIQGFARVVERDVAARAALLVRIRRHECEQRAVRARPRPLAVSEVQAGWRILKDILRA